MSNIKQGFNLAQDNPVDLSSDIQHSLYNMQTLQHPQIVLTKLTPDQQEEIQFYISQIQRLEKDYRYIKTNSIKNISQQYEKQRKAIEMEEFFRECLKASEKDILKSHEISQLNQSDKVSSSFFFELKRKKFLLENSKGN